MENIDMEIREKHEPHNRHGKNKNEIKKIYMEKL